MNVFLISLTHRMKKAEFENIKFATNISEILSPISAEPYSNNECIFNFYPTSHEKFLKCENLKVKKTLQYRFDPNPF